VSTLDDLDRFQAQLLTWLDEGHDAADVVAAARSAAPDELIDEWVAAWEPDLVELAGVLVRRWALRDPAESEWDGSRATG
jgi:hypothetical protein